MDAKIRSFSDLIAWQKAHQLTVEIYQILNRFPKTELYGLTSQIKRAVISIAANIAEGFSRKTNKDKIQFYCVALGSLTELQSHLVISRDLSFLNKESFQKIAISTIEVSKLVNSLIKNLK